MRLNFSTSLLITTSVYSHLSSSLPISEQPAENVVVLAPRYSVVPIDGGSGPLGTGPGANGGSAVPPGTVVQTVTLPPKTTETVSRSSPPETQRITDTVVLTQTAILTVDIDQPPETRTETSVVYITPSSSPPSSSPPVSSPTPSLSSDPTQDATTCVSPAISWQTASSSPTKTSTAVSTTFSSILQISVIQTAPSGSTTSVPATTPSPSTLSTSSRSLDDGQWHTTYPAWNGTMARRFVPS